MCCDLVILQKLELAELRGRTSRTRPNSSGVPSRSRPMKSAWSAWSAKALVLTWALWLSIGEAALTGDTLSSGSPVAKIVEMLTDMSSKSDEDGKAEEETFSSFKCHSTKVIESKATKMSDLEELSLSLENKIEKLTALKGELASKAVSVKKDLEKMMKQKGRLTALVRTVTRAFSPARRR